MDSANASTVCIPSSSSKTIESFSIPISKPKSVYNNLKIFFFVFVFLFFYFQTTTNSFSSQRQSEQNSSNISESMKKLLVLTQLYTLLFFSCGTRSIEMKSQQSISKKDIISKYHFG